MSLHDYAGMLFRSERISQFQRAIDDAVRPGDRVLDVGTGLGTYAFFAARSGASAVFAIDSDPVVHLAQELAVANGLDGQVEFLRGTAPGDLPSEKFDVIIFEDFSTNFLSKDTFRLLRTLQDQHLAEGGRFLPGGARLRLAPVLESASVHSPGTGPGATSSGVVDEGENFGLDWGALRTMLANTGRKEFLPATSLAAQPHEGPRLPLIPIPRASDLEITAEWSEVEGRIGGLLLWFDLDLADAGWVSNAPKEQPEPWGQWFLPLDPPMHVGRDEPLRARVGWDELEDGAPGWMGWECRWGGEVRKGHEFAGLPLAPSDLGIPGEAEAP